jgi:hypothetical protein
MSPFCRLRGTARAFKTRMTCHGKITTMRFDTKIAIVVRDGLAAWQELNVTAFLSSAVAAGVPETIGKPYEDGSGNTYLPMFRQPVLVYAAPDAAQLAEVRERAVTREMPVALYTADLFATGNDDDNRAAVRDVPAAGLDLVGLAVYGPRNRVDKVLKGLRLHG